MANKWVTHDHSNYPPGGPESAAYLADAGEFNQNYQDICDAVGARYVRGVNCEDKNSTQNTCEIWLAADGGAKDVCDADWYALIYYGTDNVWETLVQVSGADCYIVFGNDELKNPADSGVSDYSVAAFIDGLHIILFPKKMMLPADWLITAEGAGGVLGTEQIAHEGETLSAFINDVKGRLDTVCNEGEGGGLVDNVVTSDAIAGAEAVMADSPVNLLAGGSLEEYGNDDQLLFKVEKYNGQGGTYSVVSAESEPENTDGSARAQKVVTTGSNIGIALPISPHFLDTILAGKYVSASFRVKTTLNDSLDIGFWDGGANYYWEQAPAITAGQWTTLTVKKEIGTVSTLKAVIRTNQSEACTFYVARVQMNIGDKCFGFSIAPYEDAARVMMHTTADNLLFNGGFERWTLSDDSTKPPDGWHFVGSPTVNAVDGSVGGGRLQVNITLDEDDGIGQHLGIVTGGYGTLLINEMLLVGLVKDRYVCASVELERASEGGTDAITLVLGDRIAVDDEEETTLEVMPPEGDMQRFTIYRKIRDTAKNVWFRIENRVNGSTDQVIYVDNAMLHVGEFPLEFKPSAGWREMRWDFSDATAMETEHMDALGIQGGHYPMAQESAAYLMLKAAIRCKYAPAPGGADTIYQLCVDGTSANGIEVSLPAEGTSGDNHITDCANIDDQCEEYLTAPLCTQGNWGGEEAGSVIFSVWGYYYAS